MQAIPQDQNQEIFASTDSSFQRKSLATTEIQTVYERTLPKLKLSEQQSQPTTHELPFNSRAFDFEQRLSVSTEQQLIQLNKRFEVILNCLKNHSEYESDALQKAQGFRVMSIEGEQLRADYKSKMEIIGDIMEIVDNLERGGGDEFVELLDFKFQEYYLERHYGGVNEVGELGLNGKDQDSELLKNSQEDEEGYCYQQGEVSIENRGHLKSQLIEEMQQQVNEVELHNEQKSVVSEDSNSEVQAYIISRIGNTQSLLNNPINYLSTQTQTLPPIPLQIPYLLQIPIPLIVAKSHIEESTIENIINHYSKPYEELYLNQYVSPSTTQEALPSALESFTRPKYTEVQLMYSDLPGSTGFNLPLDSYAQIQSLISNDSNSKPPTDRSLPCYNEPIHITQKTLQNSSSLLERYEQNERMLNQQNTQLRETVDCLCGRVGELQKMNHDLEKQKNKLMQKLEEEIQQNEYCMNKLEEMDVQMMEQRLHALTNLTQTQERRMENLNEELRKKTEIIEKMEMEMQSYAESVRAKEQELMLQSETIQQLSQSLQQKQFQIVQLGDCGQDVFQRASDAELELKKEISVLQQEKSNLQDKVKIYHKLLESQGISLQYEEATELQGIIEAQEHTHKMEIKDINMKYQEIVGLYREELNTLNQQLQEIMEMNKRNGEVIEQQKRKEKDSVRKQKENIKEFQAIVQEYDRELEEKDQQIEELKKKQELFEQGESGLLLGPWQRALELLERQLERERKEKYRISERLVEIDRYIHTDMQQREKEVDKESGIIEQLTQQLEQQLRENQQLRQLLQQQTQKQNQVMQNMLPNETIQELQQSNHKVKKVNGRLKRYTKSLQEELRAVCGVDACQGHKNWLEMVIEQRDFYLSLVTQKQIAIC